MSDLTLVPPPSSPPSPLPPLARPSEAEPLSPHPAPPTSRANRIELSKRDLSVLALSKTGLDEDAIATRLHMPVVRVQASLLKFYRRQLAASSELFQMRVNEMGLDRIAEVNSLIAEGLAATRPIKNDKGEITAWVPDHTERREMARLLKEWVQAAQPKVPLINQNINQNNQQNNFNSGRALNMEGRLRAIREKNGLKNDDDVVVDAEFEEDDIEGDEAEEDVELEGDDENSTQE